MDPFERSKKNASASSRTFFSRTLRRLDGGSDSSKDLKSPLGLTTLFDPSTAAIADLIFVHGLGGGSQSTWTKSDNPSLYWPRGVATERCGLSRC